MSIDKKLDNVVMKNIHWGIMGTGAIARKFAADLALVEDSSLVAIGSRTMTAATQFAINFQIEHIHGSYAGLALNPFVDVIYIATPHHLHYENTLLCLNSGKAVLCEKPFAINLTQAEAMVKLAKEKKLFLMEALWTKFLPHFIEMQRMIVDGLLGEIRVIKADFGFKPQLPINNRLFDPELGGGSLMDIGIYNVFLALTLLGKPDQIDASMILSKSGVDEQCSVTFRYDNGAIAQLLSSLAADLPTEADICGTEGRIRLISKFYEPAGAIEYTNILGRKVIPVLLEKGFGYQYEARHVADCLRKDLTESPVHSFADTLLLTETLDQIRTIAGIRYPADTSPNLL